MDIGEGLRFRDLFRGGSQPRCDSRLAEARGSSLRLACAEALLTERRFATLEISDHEHAIVRV